MSAGRIFMYLNAALIAGIALGSFVASLFCALVVVFVFIVTVSFFLPKKSIAVILGCSVVFGWLFVNLAVDRAHNEYDSFASTVPTTVSGSIVSLQQDQNRVKLVVHTHSYSLIASTYNLSFREGDEVVVMCDDVRDDLYLPQYISNHIIANCVGSDVVLRENAHKSPGIQNFRNVLLEKIYRALPSPQAEFLQGLLLGKQAALPQELSNALRRTGTTHIVVLSGFNITVIAFVLFSVLRRFRFRIGVSTLISIVAIWCFVTLAGFTPPTTRAAIMVTLVLVAKSRGRPHTTLATLLLSASILLFADPLLLRWSVSFQLSFLATLGVLLKDRFIPELRFLPENFSLQDNIRTTMAATFTTLPLLIVVFGSVSFVGLITNAFILSLVPLAMGLGVIIIPLSLVDASIGMYAGLPAYIVLKIMTSIITFFAQLPFAFMAASTWMAIVPIVCIAAGAIWKHQHVMGKETPQKKFHMSYMIVPACVLAIVVAWHAFLPHDNEVSFFDVGQGDAILVRGEHNADMLIDAGPDETVVPRLGEALPYNDRRIEVFALTHPHADHLKGFFSLLDKYEIGEVWVSESNYKSSLFTSFFDQCETRHISVHIVHQGDSLDVGNIHVLTLWPAVGFQDTNANNESLVFRATVKGTTFLFTGDIEERVEKTVGSDESVFLDVDVLKVPHHGGKTSSTSDFLQLVSPLVSVISVGQNNSYGHPHKEALERLHANSRYLLTTEQCGTITILINNGLYIDSRCDGNDL